MPDTIFTRKSRRQFARLIIVGMFVQLACIAYVFLQSYDGRKDLIRAQRAECVRSKQDRQANAKGWRIAEAARRQSGQIAVANKYRIIAVGLDARSRIGCSQAYPKARALP